MTELKKLSDADLLSKLPSPRPFEFQGGQYYEYQLEMLSRLSDEAIQFAIEFQTLKPSSQKVFRNLIHELLA